MLALREIEYKNFSIDNLIGDTTITDGQKIYNAIKANLNRANVTPDTKKDKILSQFSVIKDNTKINIVDDTLKKTPLKHYTEYFQKHKIQQLLRRLSRTFLWGVHVLFWG